MYGDRVKQARELCGLTQSELAGSVGVRQSAIAQIESDAFTPSDTVLQAIAIRTGFDLAFLKQDTPPVEFPIGSALYRAQAKVKPKEKALAHRTAQLMFQLAQTMRAKLKEIVVTIPRMSEPPEVCARIARASFGLSPESPIPNLVKVVERAGVMILPLPLNIEGLDGFSAWVGPNHDIPLICMVQGKRGFRPRFTLAEELCHLIKHTPLRCSVVQADEEARRFAGELLLPEDVIREWATQPITLSSLFPLKKRHQVSLQFAIRRVFDLGLITANQYRYLNMQVSARGWKKEEPGDDTIVLEQPQMFAKMIEVVYGVPPDLTRMRQDLGKPPMSLLRAFVPAELADTGKAGNRVISFALKRGSGLASAPAGETKAE